MNVFVARQPIFNRKNEVFAYELLFRSSLANLCTQYNGDLATSQVLADSFLLLGIESLTGGKKAFINFTSNLLKEGYPGLFPPDLIGIEILETVEGDEEIIKICQNLKSRGYLLILDDFALSNKSRALLPLADIVKVDFQESTEVEKIEYIREYGREELEFLAEKVETHEEYVQAREYGYNYFQGYYFCRPYILKGKDIPAYKITAMQLLEELHKPDPDFEKLSSFVSRDVAMSYKLLKLVNSAAFGFRTKIKSVKHALVILGMKEIRKWLTLMTMRNMGEDKPDELLMSSIIRARFGELVAWETHLEEKSADIFMMGLFSLIDALLDRPMEDVLNELPLDDDIKEPLLGRGGNLEVFYDLTKAYEVGSWPAVTENSQKLGINTERVPPIFLQSVEWANEFFPWIR